MKVVLWKPTGRPLLDSTLRADPMHEVGASTGAIRRTPRARQHAPVFAPGAPRGAEPVGDLSWGALLLAAGFEPQVFVGIATAPEALKSRSETLLYDQALSSVTQRSSVSRLRGPHRAGPTGHPPARAGEGGCPSNRAPARVDETGSVF